MPNRDVNAPDVVLESIGPTRVHVAVGVISDGADRILIAKRAEHLHQGGLWEFPGGKVEVGETIEAALRRELFEELAIEIVAQRPLLQIAHDYGDKSVLLDVWWIDTFHGEPQSKEGQPLRWVSVTVLHEFEFPAANKPIIEAVQKQFSMTTI